MTSTKSALRRETARAEDLTVKDRSELLQLIRRYAILEAGSGTLFTLANGSRSQTFIDIKRASMHSDVQSLLASHLYGAVLSFMPIDVVAGVALGGCHLASIVALHAEHVMTVPVLDVLYIRKERSDHGLRNIVEGPILKGARVVLCEDVVTTGESSVKAIDRLCDVGCDVQGVVAVIDRRRNVGDTLPDGTKIRGLFTLDELIYGSKGERALGME